MTDDNTIRKLLPWGLLAAAAAALGTAYTAQWGFGYEPCVLCLYQRVPYALIAVLGLAGLFVKDADKQTVIALLAGLVFLVGGGIAFYHVGVEQAWWHAVTSCGAGSETVTTTQDLFASLQQKPEKPCDEVDWTLFGVSMATYNAVVSLLLALALFWAWRRLKGSAR